MKKTVLLLTCALPIVLTACYSTMDEDRARTQKRRNYQSVMGCQVDDVYQHAGYKDCVEATLAEKEKKRKTVYLTENIEGSSMVVPKGDGDLEMLDPTAVYEVVTVKTTTVEEEEVSNGVNMDASAVITDESLIYIEGADKTAESAATATKTTTTTVTTVTSEKSSTLSEEDLQKKLFGDDTGVKSTRTYEETSEKISLDSPLVEKERKISKESLPSEKK